MQNIELKVPLSGSKLFDLNTLVTAKRLCEKFPGLKYDYGKDCIIISGELNDYWYKKYMQAVFEIGNIENS